MQFVADNVPTLQSLQALGPGAAYHYTGRWNEIQACGKLLGAPIDQNLDHTQETLNSPPAMHDPGVVFAYSELTDAYMEGFSLDVIRIHYASALQASHVQEATCDAPPTILILTGEVVGFDYVGKAPDF